MKFILTCILCLWSLFALADEVDALHQQKASDFFKNAHMKKRNLLKELDGKKSQPGDKKFILEGEFGVLNTRGNTSTSLIKLAFDAQHNMQNWVNEYYLQALRRSSSTQGVNLDTNRFQISAEFDYRLIKGKNRLFLFTEYDDNQFLQLRDQFTAVVGWRHILIDDEDMKLRYSIGPGFTQFKQELTGFEQEGLIVRGTANFSYTFDNDTRFRQNLSAELSEMATKARSVTTLSAKVFESLAMKLTFEMVLDENVAQSVEEFSTQTSVSLVYQFF